MSIRLFLVTFVKVWVVTAFTMSLLGCQLVNYINDEAKNTNTYHQKNTSFGQYYLWIKQLNKYELIAEIKAQKRQVKLIKSRSDNVTAQYRLLLLHSLANTSMPNKSVLEFTLARAELTSQEQAQLSASDLALLLMAKEQLEQRLLVNHALLKKEEINTKAKKQIKKQQQSIENLELRAQKLQQQIIQLKEIERSINEHGTPL